MYQRKTRKYQVITRRCTDLHKVLEQLIEHKKNIVLHAKTIRLFKNMLSYANSMNYNKTNYNFTTWVDGQKVDLSIYKINNFLDNERRLYRRCEKEISNCKEVLNDTFKINTSKLTISRLENLSRKVKRKELRFKKLYELYNNIRNSYLQVCLYKKEIKSFTRQMNNATCDSAKTMYNGDIIRSTDYYQLSLNQMKSNIKALTSHHVKYYKR